MENRKQKEIEFHNERERERRSFNEAEFRKKHSNKKFYSVTGNSSDYLYNWIKDRCKGKKVLDYCCGTGCVSMFLAQHGAEVVGIDISDLSIDQCKAEAKKLGVEGKTSFHVMDAENTNFDDDTFDYIVCSGVLHHLDLEKAFSELSRLLKPDGEVFCGEPLKHNPVFQLYRRLTPHIRTKWETDHILRMRDVLRAKSYFESVEYKFFNLAVMAAVPLRNTKYFEPSLKVLNAVDDVILKIPYFNRLAWMVYFFLSKPKKA